MGDNEIDKRMDHIDQLLETQCFVMDILPERVPKNSKGQFFLVEDYLLNSDRHYALKDRFVNVILKLMCYYHISIMWDTWIDYPTPEIIDTIINEIMDKQTGTLNILFPEDDALLVFEWDCLNLSVYNPSENMKVMMCNIARSEGLFWWESKD